MSQNPFANYPFLLGFEQVERLIDRASKSSADGYPPYNIEQISDGAYRITLAVAGFSEANLSVTLEDNQLVVRGRQPETPEPRVFLHRGIAARQFQRNFVLADGIEISGAALDNGLLHVDLKRSEPDTVIQTIKINRSPA